MSGKRITIKDIATRLNLSTSTVSRALSDHSDVSAETRQMVRHLAEVLDYQPDPIAVNFRQRRSNVIGVIIPQLVNQFFSKALAGMQQVASESGYNIIISQSDESLAQEKENVQAMLLNRVDGLIVSLSRETIGIEHFQKWLNTETPLIFFDRVSEGLEVSSVVIDDYDASYKAVAHLIEHGCRRIALVVGPPNLFNCRKRLEGYKDAIRDRGFPLDKKLVVFASYKGDNVSEYTDYLLKLPDPPDGILAVNDASAIEMMYYIQQTGLRIPYDIAMVGFNNDSIGNFIHPKLTSVESPAYELGKMAAYLLLNHLRDEALPYSCQVIKSRLVIRESSLKGEKAGA